MTKMHETSLHSPQVLPNTMQTGTDARSIKNGDDHPPASPHCRDASRNRYPDRIKGGFDSGGWSISHQFRSGRRSGEGSEGTVGEALQGFIWRMKAGDWEEFRERNF